MSSLIPKELKYTEDHEWVKVDGDTATVGITDHAQSELGDIIFIEFPEINDLIDRMEPFGTIEAVKTVADLFAPLNGKIVEINEALEDSPELVNSDAYGEGWIVKVSVDDLDQLNDLLSSENYEKLIS
jgi:glycine cleavage system H protein